MIGLADVSAEFKIIYFTIENPTGISGRWLNRYRHSHTAVINGHELRVRWTERAERALRRAGQPLVVEMQLYFSCVVKKRVLFHQHADFDTVAVDARLKIGFRPIASAVCDPRRFAESYPEGRDLARGKAANMVPRFVEIDFRRGDWEGHFGY